MRWWLGGLLLLVVADPAAAQETAQRIVQACEIDAPNDYALQAACVRHQRQAAGELVELNKGAAPNSLRKRAIHRCLGEMRHRKVDVTDYVLARACYRQQNNGYRQLHGRDLPAD